MAKKKIAMFCAGWGADILLNYGRGIEKAMEDYNVNLYVFLAYPTYTDDECIQKGELNIFELPDLADFDGAILLGNGLDFKGCYEGLVERIKEAGIPCVSTGRKADGVYYVGCDNYVGAYDLANHLIEKHGIRNPWFIAGMINNPDSNARLKALRDAMAKHAMVLPEEHIFYSKWEPKLACLFVDRIMRSSSQDKPDAIICANDSLAMNVADVVKNAGYAVPGDVVVTGYDNEYYSRIYDPVISTVDQNFYELGQESLRTLMDVIDGKDRPWEQEIPSTFIEGESCGCMDPRDLYSMRRPLGTRAYMKDVADSLFHGMLRKMEHTIANGSSYEDLRDNLKRVYETDHDYTGDTYHIVLEPIYEKDVYNPNRRLSNKGYSRKMDAIFSIENGNISRYENFDAKEIAPGAAEGSNKLYISMPLHDRGFNLGYFVFCDGFEKLGNYNRSFLYVSRLSMILSKYRQNLSLLNLNQRLLELTETDSLTHVKNSDAYDNKEIEFNTKMRVLGSFSFGIAVFNINNMKQINDEYGHDAGDAYINNCCVMICKIFKRSPVYRMEGDEFCVILTGDDYDNRETLMNEFKKQIDELLQSDIPATDKLSIAGGIAAYDSTKDKCVSDVYRRADSMMYQNKAAMKQ